MKITPIVLLLSTLTATFSTLAKTPTVTAEKPEYMVEAKIIEEYQSANNKQEILSCPKMTLSPDSGGTTAMTEKLSFGDLTDQPSPGIIFQAWLKTHEGTIFLSVKTTICQVVDKAKPNPPEVSWITTQSLETWIYAKLDTLPKVIKIPELIINGRNYHVELHVKQVIHKSQPVSGK